MTTVLAGEEEPMKYRDFTITGRIYGPNESVAKHNVYWALRNSEYDDQILINEISIGGEE